MLGIYPVRIVEDYFEDKESLNYGVLVTWKNPFYKFTRLFPFIADLLNKLWRRRVYKAYDVFKVGKRTFNFTINRMNPDKIIMQGRS